MASNIICIFPKDETTDFLFPVYESLSKSDSFWGIRSNNNEELFQSVREKMESIKDQNNLIIFIGHGASNCLYGTPVNDEKIKLFEQSNISLFANQSVFFLSCRSSEFINSIPKGNKVNGIGFGDIITEYREVVAERDTGDFSFGADINIEVIENFNNLLVNIIKDTFEYSASQNMDLDNLFLNLKLIINKNISDKLVNKNIKYYRTVADLLVNMKWDIDLTKTS